MSLKGLRLRCSFDILSLLIFPFSFLLYYFFLFLRFTIKLINFDKKKKNYQCISRNLFYKKIYNKIIRGRIRKIKKNRVKRIEEMPHTKVTDKQKNKIKVPRCQSILTSRSQCAKELQVTPSTATRARCQVSCVKALSPDSYRRFCSLAKIR